MHPHPWIIGSLRCFEEIADRSLVIFLLVLAVSTLLLPIIIASKIWRAQRVAQRNAVAGAAAVQMAEVAAEDRAPMNEKVLIDLSAG